MRASPASSRIASATAFRCDSFHFGSGYTSIGNRRYVFNWNRDKFPDPAATMARLNAAGMQPVTNIKPCLLDDHPRLAEARASGILVAGRRDRRAGGRAVLGRPRLPCRLHQSRRAAQWWATASADALLDYGVDADVERQQRIRDLGRGRDRDGDGRPYPQALARPAQALLMTKLAYETQAARTPGQAPLRHHARRRRRHRALRPDLVAATTKPPGRRCATI